MKKTGRNDPCPCGSGKKFKKCCESKMLGGRFMATRIQDSSLPTPRQISNLTGFFQSKVSKPPEPPKTPPEEPPTPENPNKEIEP